MGTITSTNGNQSGIVRRFVSSTLGSAAQQVQDSRNWAGAINGGLATQYLAANQCINQAPNQ